jgi:hypothetical protein
MRTSKSERSGIPSAASARVSSLSDAPTGLKFDTVAHPASDRTTRPAGFRALVEAAAALPRSDAALKIIEIDDLAFYDTDRDTTQRLPESVRRAARLATCEH